MAQSFSCFIEFNGQKYDIIINEDINSVGFKDIYQKIQQIIKLVLKQDIGFATHIFEVFDNNSSEGLVVRGFNYFVKNLSTIRIHRNPVVSPPNLVPFNPNLPPIVSTPLPFVPSIPTPSTSSKKADDDFIPHEYYCDLCPKYVHKIDKRLKKYKLNLNFESYKRFSDLMTTIKELSESDCDTISDNQWLSIIPYKMRAFGHKDFSQKLWKNSFEVFLKKYIEVMDVSPNWYVSCSLFPFFHEYNGFEFNKSGPNYKRITELRQKLNTSLSESQQLSEKDKKKFQKLVQHMMDKKEDIKVFHIIVQLINESKLVFKKKTNKKWQQISENLTKKEYFPNMYSTSNCRDKFFKWITWYSQNYLILNGFLKPKEQEVFDLLKIVHILDFFKFWSFNNTIHSRLRTLSVKRDIKLYLNDLENRKLKLKRINRKMKTSFSNFNTFVDKDLNTEDKDLEDYDECSECLCLSRDCQCSLQPQSGQKSQSIVPSSDPQNKPINGVTFQSEVTPLPKEKAFATNTLQSKSDCLNPIVLDVEEGEVIEETTRAAKPLINLNESVVLTNASKENSIQKAVLSTDLCLMSKTSDKNDVNNDSIVISVKTKPSVESSMSPNQSTASEIVSLSKPPNPSNIDPRFQRKCYSNGREEDTLPEIQIIDIVNRSKPIAVSTNNRTAQPLDSIRDPRLKRKHQQNEQSVNESSGQSSVQNSSKKSKTIPIIRII